MSRALQSTLIVGGVSLPTVLGRLSGHVVQDPRNVVVGNGPQSKGFDDDA